MNLEKLKRMAGGLDAFFKVFLRIMIIALAVAVVIVGSVTLLFLVKPETAAKLSGGFLSVDVGPFTFDLEEGYAPGTGAVLAYIWAHIGLTVLTAAVIGYFIVRVRKILQPMKQGNPFHESVSAEIRRIAFASLFMGVIGNLATVLEDCSAMLLFGKEHLIGNGRIRSVTVNIEPEPGFVIVFLVLLLISWIFRYGEELQKLSDETL